MDTLESADQWPEAQLQTSVKQTMQTPPIPENEPERLQALQRYRILDTTAEDAFEDLTRLAAYICDTPIALVSLVDQHRQWFKSTVGLAATHW